MFFTMKSCLLFLCSTAAHPRETPHHGALVPVVVIVPMEAMQQAVVLVESLIVTIVMAL